MMPATPCNHRFKPLTDRWQRPKIPFKEQYITDQLIVQCCKCWKVFYTSGNELVRMQVEDEMQRNHQ